MWAGEEREWLTGYSHPSHKVLIPDDPMRRGSPALRCSFSKRHLTPYAGARSVSQSVRPSVSRSLRSEISRALGRCMHVYKPARCATPVLRPGLHVSYLSPLTPSTPSLWALALRFCYFLRHLPLTTCVCHYCYQTRVLDHFHHSTLNPFSHLHIYIITGTEAPSTRLFLQKACHRPPHPWRPPQPPGHPKRRWPPTPASGRLLPKLLPSRPQLRLRRGQPQWGLVPPH